MPTRYEHCVCILLTAQFARLLHLLNLLLRIVLCLSLGSLESLGVHWFLLVSPLDYLVVLVLILFELHHTLDCLSLACSSVYLREVLQQLGVFLLHHEHCAPNFDDVRDPQRVQRRLFTLGTESEPSPVRRAHVLKVETLLARRVDVGDLGVVIAHLRVFRDAEGVVGISSNAKTIFIYCNHSVAGRTLEDVQLNHVWLGSPHNLEFAQPHLEHHVILQLHFLPHHEECSSSRTNISQQELCAENVAVLLIWTELDLTMTSGDEGLRNHNFIRSGMSSQCCPLLPNNVHVVQQLSFDCLQD